VVLRDVIVTVAKDDKLIRISQNTYAEGRAPFIYFPLIPDGGKLVGYGITSMSLKVLDWANQLQNMGLDILKRQAYPARKFVDDKVFDPSTVVNRPGAMIQVGDLGNLIPLDDRLDNLQWLKDERESLKVEFEECTIPRMLKGQMVNG
jgi:hypothetical protein